MKSEKTIVRDVIDSLVKKLPAIFKQTSIMSICINEQDHLEDYMMKVISKDMGEYLKENRVHIRIQSIRDNISLPDHVISDSSPYADEFDHGDIIISSSIWAAFNEDIVYGVICIKEKDDYEYEVKYQSRDKIKARNPIHIGEFNCY